MRVIRLPIELETDIDERKKINKAHSILATYGWDVGIRLCINNGDMESLSMLPLIQNISTFLYANTLPVIKIR